MCTLHSPAYRGRSRNKGAGMKTCEEAALRKLAVRSLSVQELRCFLRRKGYGTDETEKAIEECISYGYLDDRSFAREYFLCALRKNKGEHLISSELGQKGIDSDVLSEVYEELKEKGEIELDEFARAKAEAEKVLRIAEIPDGNAVPAKIKARIARRLERYGYPASIIYSVLEDLDQ